MESTPTRGYSASKQRLLNRLTRVEGQVRGVTRMVEWELGLLTIAGIAWFFWGPRGAARSWSAERRRR